MEPMMIGSLFRARTPGGESIVTAWHLFQENETRQDLRYTLIPVAGNEALIHELYRKIAYRFRHLANCPSIARIFDENTSQTLSIMGYAEIRGRSEAIRLAQPSDRYDLLSIDVTRLEGLAASAPSFEVRDLIREPLAVGESVTLAGFSFEQGSYAEIACRFEMNGHFRDERRRPGNQALPATNSLYMNFRCPAQTRSLAAFSGGVFFDAQGRAVGMQSFETSNLNAAANAWAQPIFAPSPDAANSASLSPTPPAPNNNVSFQSINNCRLLLRDQQNRSARAFTAKDAVCGIRYDEGQPRYFSQPR
jgi:hypothetical protein